MDTDLYDEILRETEGGTEKDEESYVYHGRFAEKNGLYYEDPNEIVEEVTVVTEEVETSNSPDRPMWTKITATEDDIVDNIVVESPSNADSGNEEIKSERQKSRDPSPEPKPKKTSEEKEEKSKSRVKSSKKRKRERKSRSKSHSPKRRHHNRCRSLTRSRSNTFSISPIRSPKKSSKPRESRSSSRGTYEGFDVILPEEDCPYSCKTCRRGFYTIRELSEHEIRMHDNEISCTLCDKKSISVAKLAAHIVYRHPTKPVVCYYCDEKFGSNAEDLENKKWESFREHVYKEILKKQMYKHTSKNGSNINSDSVAMRGVGSCPHGPPIKCKNFPVCPGAKCIYSHGKCRYESTCNKQTCPFDHSHRPRTCMTCVNDKKFDRRRRRL